MKEHDDHKSPSNFHGTDYTSKEKYWSIYRKDQQSQRLNWFNRLAKEEGKSLHIAAGWSYLTDDQFNGLKF